MKRSFSILLILTASLLSLQWISPVFNYKYLDVARNLDIFTTLFRDLNFYYVDEINPSVVIDEGVQSMLASLDPYTNYIPESSMDSYQTLSTGEYAGVGISVIALGDKVYVNRVFEGFSAFKEGVKIGDELLSVAGAEVRNDNIPEIGKLMKGREDSSVEIIVRRGEGEQEIKFILQRERISLPSVPYFSLMDEGVAYLKLDEFTIGAGRETRRALLQLKSEGAESLILDLRGNPGGLLSEAVNVSNLFINKGSLVVSTKGRNENWNKDYNALDEAVDLSIPLVVLVDELSASAAEIVAGVIQDYDRGILVGQKTFGKGLVQTTRDLPYEGQLKITAAKYYIPSGRCIQSAEYGQNPEGNSSLDFEHKFMTKGGREVLNSSGLHPDVHINRDEFPPLLASVIKEGVVFRFVNRLFYSDEKYAHLDYEVSDDDFDWFVEYVKSFEKNRVVNPGQQIQNIILEAEKENMPAEIISELEKMPLKAEESFIETLFNHKKELKNLIGREIYRRKYFYRGKIEYSLKYDLEIVESKTILADKLRYSEILQ